MPARVDPFGNFNFRVEIDGLPVASFAECSGLTSEVDVIEYREGGDPTVRKLPGMRKVGDITLKRGVTSSADLQAWLANVLSGAADRRNGSVILLDESGQDVVRWKFIGAFPRKWEGPVLSGKGNDVAIETLTLSCERLERVS